MTEDINVCCFSCSRHRPVLLRSSVLQLLNQTYPSHISVYINTNDLEGNFDYSYLLKDLPKNRLTVAFGKSESQHKNHMIPLQNITFNDYDLFLKIDDDDVYFNTYIEDIVSDFIKNNWDFSGTFSEGLINGKHWFPNKRITHLNFSEKDKSLGVLPMLPHTYAFSKKAMTKIMELEDFQGWEDPVWRQVITDDPHLKVAQRKQSNTIYHIHGKNVSTAHHYQHE